MSEQRDKLRAALGELRGELHHIADVDPEVRAMLEGTIADIHTVLDKPGEAGGVGENAPESIVERLSEAARHFEDTHPTFSGILGSTIDALSRMGI